MHNTTNSSPASVLSPLCFHGLTNCFSRKPFVFRKICVATPGVPYVFAIQSSVTPGFNVFQQLADSFALFALFLHTRAFVFSRLTDSFAKYPGGGGGQRGRGRNGGRAVSGRGRMRKRGPSGGGTLRSELPQQGQRPSSQNARVASARSQWPLASHCGLMHWTVKPGRNCISFSPQRPARFCAAGRVARDPNSLTDGCWRGFWRFRVLLSREKTTICWGTVAGVRWQIRCP